MNITTPTGSLFNNIHANSRQPVPAVGMGATELMYTDRHAGTITAVHANKRGEIVAFVFQQDTADRTDSKGMSDSQSYTYAPNPNGRTCRVTLRRNGRWVREGESQKNGTPFAVGHRDEYHDYSF